MKKIINGFLLVLIIIISSTNMAFSYTQEIVKATPYYAHPVTGAIEDPGNNPGIGQGMTENVVCPQALMETTDDGRIFLSVRYNLANYIKNETFAVQNYGDTDFYSVAAKVTAQTEETRDYRFEIPSKNTVVRATFFVGPMGRDVIFYYTISDPVEGNTDFVPLQSESTSEGQGQVIEDKRQETIIQSPETKNPLPNMEGLTPVENNVQVGQVLGPQSEGEKIEQKIVNSKMSAGDLGYSHGLLTKDSPIIKKLYYSEDSKGEEESKEKTQPGKITMAFIYGLIGLLVILTASSISLATLSYFYKQKVEEDLEEKRRQSYE
ncbi:hypothetical protein HMPREF3189_00726 [Clostridiales bacterium KA00134]|nr:hypothetical protein HMPREF3189_00726 [Clostridiales bacterium KA00134]